MEVLLLIKWDLGKILVFLCNGTICPMPVRPVMKFITRKEQQKPLQNLQNSMELKFQEFLYKISPIGLIIKLNLLQNNADN